MKNPMDLQSIFLAAANRNREQPGLGSAVDELEQQADHGQFPQDDEPRLPEGYRPIRNAIQALLMYGAEEN